MARTLPWLKSGSITTPQPGPRKPAKRQRMLDPNNDSDDNVKPRAVAHPKKQAAPAAGKLCLILRTYID